MCVCTHRHGAARSMWPRAPTPASCAGRWPGLTGEGVGEGDEGGGALGRDKGAGVGLHHGHVAPPLLLHLLAGLRQYPVAVPSGERQRQSHALQQYPVAVPSGDRQRQSHALQRYTAVPSGERQRQLHNTQCRRARSQHSPHPKPGPWRGGAAQAGSTAPAQVPPPAPAHTGAAACVPQPTAGRLEARLRPGGTPPPPPPPHPPTCLQSEEQRSTT